MCGFSMEKIPCDFFTAFFRYIISIYVEFNCSSKEFQENPTENCNRIVSSIFL